MKFLKHIFLLTLSVTISLSNLFAEDKGKSNKDKTINVASVDELGPFLTRFYSEKQLLQMDEKQIESILQDLLEKGVL